MIPEELLDDERREMAKEAKRQQLPYLPGPLEIASITRAIREGEVVVESRDIRQRSHKGRQRNVLPP